MAGGLSHGDGSFHVQGANIDCGADQVWIDEAHCTQTAVAVAAISAVACAQAASVQEIFEKYNLVGIFAQDCTKPATVQSPRNGAPQNWWFVNRLIDANHAQRDFMEGPRALAVL